MLTHYSLLLSVVILSNHYLVQAATYDDAECNGCTIVALNAVQAENAIKLELGEATPFDIPITGTTTEPSEWMISATAIEPCSQTVYTLIFDNIGAGKVSWNLATLSDPFSIVDAQIAAGPDISGDLNIRDRLPAMAFNNEGTLFILSRDRDIFELDTTTGNTIIRDTRTETTGDVCSGNSDCMEALGFNWDNGLFYRISSSTSTTNTNIMECFEIGDSNPGMLLTWTDADLLCDNRVYELTYIGNSLWLIACDGIRLLDTSDGSTAVVTHVGTNGITQAGGSGLIASINENGAIELCEVQCPTSSPTEYPTQPSQNPTTDPTASSDSDSNDSFEYALIGEDVKEDNDVSETNKTVVIDFSDSSIYQLWAIVILIVFMIGSGALYCHYSRKN